MADECSSNSSKACCGDSCAPPALVERQRNILIWVLIINAGMFVVEASAGWVADSSALLANLVCLVIAMLFLHSAIQVVGRAVRQLQVAK